MSDTELYARTPDRSQRSYRDVAATNTPAAGQREIRGLTKPLRGDSSPRTEQSPNQVVSPENVYENEITSSDEDNRRS